MNEKLPNPESMRFTKDSHTIVARVANIIIYDYAHAIKETHIVGLNTHEGYFPIRERVIWFLKN